MVKSLNGVYIITAKSVETEGEWSLINSKFLKLKLFFSSFWFYLLLFILVLWTATKNEIFPKLYIENNIQSVSYVPGTFRKTKGLINTVLLTVLIKFFRIFINMPVFWIIVKNVIKFLLSLRTAFPKRIFL